MEIQNLPGVALVQKTYDVITLKPIFKRIQQYKHDYVLSIKDDGRDFTLTVMGHDDTFIVDGAKNEKYAILDPTVELNIPFEIKPGIFRMFIVSKCGTTVKLTKEKDGEPEKVLIDGRTAEIIPGRGYYGMVAMAKLLGSVVDNSEANKHFNDKVSYTTVFLGVLFGAFIGMILGMVIAGAIHL